MIVYSDMGLCRIIECAIIQSHDNQSRSMKIRWSRMKIISYNWILTENCFFFFFEDLMNFVINEER